MRVIPLQLVDMKILNKLVKREEVRDHQWSFKRARSSSANQKFLATFQARNRGFHVYIRVKK